ncbi:MAG: hypothetical protein ACT4O9_16350 [Blastocatellia bacterium]
MAFNEEKFETEEEQRIAGQLRGLRRVEAPQDFDMRLKARFANHRPSNDGVFPRLIFMKFALPAIVLAAFGIFLFSASIFGPDISVPPVVTEAPRDVSQPAFSNEQMASAENSQKPSTEPNTSREPSSNLMAEKRNERPRDRKDGNGGGSVDMTVRGTEKPVLPSGIDPERDANTNRPAGFDGAGVLPAKDMLSFLGIKAELEAGKWRVKSVSDTSTAGRSGVMADDVIEAVDNTPLDGGTRLRGGESIRTLVIRRNGETVRINLKN